MFTPKLIVTDLDKTALKDDKSVSPATIQAFAQCQAMGIPVVIATARYIAGARPYVRLLHPDYLILTDGTLVYQQQRERLRLVYSNAMDVKTTNQLLTELKQAGYASHIAIPTVYGLFRYPDGCPADFTANGDTVAVSEPVLPELDFHSKAFQTTSDGNTIGYHFDIHKPFPHPGNKLVAWLPDDQTASRIADVCGCKQFHYHGENLYTFYSMTASKMDAIRHVTQQLNISVEDVLVFGDDINDMEMIANCGMGVAMKNALPEVKAAANDITLSNEEDGVAWYLNHYVLH